MGMFDYVNYKADCWKCGASLNDFQSKDAECLMDHIEVSRVRRFYAICPSKPCQAWNEFRVLVEAYRVERVIPEENQ